jgi:1-deoxy-D-xylulose-5-phosphate reductoisomerase
LHFTEPELKRFPCLVLAFAAAKQGGTSPTILNAANEIAVAAFLSGKLPYLRIAQVVEATLNHLESKQAQSIEDVLESDLKAREAATTYLIQA